MPKEFLVTENGWRIPRYTKTEKILFFLASTAIGNQLLLSVYRLTNLTIPGYKEQKREFDIFLMNLPKHVRGVRALTLDFMSGDITGWIVSPGEPRFKNSRIPTAEELNNYSNYREARRSTNA